MRKKTPKQNKGQPLTSTWLGLTDPTNTPIKDPVIINHPRFLEYTYDRTSVETAWKNGELKPFGIETTAQFVKAIIPRHLVRQLNQYVIKNLNNQTDLENDKKNDTNKVDIDKVYSSPISHTFPHDKKNRVSYICSVDGYTYSSHEHRTWFLEKKNSPINRQPVEIQQLSEDRIAKKIFDHYQRIQHKKISNQEFAKILLKEFNGWKELNAESGWLEINRSTLTTEIISIILTLSMMNAIGIIPSNLSCAQAIFFFSDHLWTRSSIKLSRDFFQFKSFILFSSPFLLCHLMITPKNLLPHAIFFFIRSCLLMQNLIDASKIKKINTRILYQENPKFIVTMIVGTLCVIFDKDNYYFITNVMRYNYWTNASFLGAFLPPSLEYNIFSLVANTCVSVGYYMYSVSSKIISLSYLADQLVPENTGPDLSTKNIALIPRSKYNYWLKVAHFLLAILVGIFFFSYEDNEKYSSIAVFFFMGINQFLSSLLPLALESMVYEPEPNRYRLLPRPQTHHELKQTNLAILYDEEKANLN